MNAVISRSDGAQRVVSLSHAIDDMALAGVSGWFMEVWDEHKAVAWVDADGRGDLDLVLKIWG